MPPLPSHAPPLPPPPPRLPGQIVRAILASTPPVKHAALDAIYCAAQTAYCRHLGQQVRAWGGGV